MTFTVARPRLAIRPSAAGPRVWPRRSAGWPCMRSSPLKRRLSPALRMPGGRVMCSPSTFTNSSGTTVSRPAGMMAPVMIFTHWPGPTLPLQALPANAVPTTCSARA